MMLIETKFQLQNLKNQVLTNAQQTLEKVAEILKEDQGITAMTQLRFEQCGAHPTRPEQPLNFFEQINRGF